MKLIYKIMIANIAISFLVAVIFAVTAGGVNSADDFAIVFGLVCLVFGLLNLFAGLIMLFTKEKAWQSGLLLSGAALLLLSGISCGSGLVLS